MPRAFAILCLMLCLSFPLAANAQISAPLVALQHEDLRLARIADGLLTANRGLCRQVMPVTGMLIHSRDQYGPQTSAEFANGPVSIAAIVPGSAADDAELKPGDGLVAIAGHELADLPPPAEGPLRDAVFRLLAERPAAEPIELRIARAGREFASVLPPQPGCRALVEVLAETRRVARSDGRVIQLSYGLATDMSDDGLAAILAHELAHVVLEHRRRLSEAGVKKGFFGEFGGNRRRNRAAEVEADRLSVHLLANAGFDPQVGPRFWLSPEGRSVDAGIFRSSIYPSPSSRAEIMQRELDEFLPQGRGPSWPGHLLALRDAGF